MKQKRTDSNKPLSPIARMMDMVVRCTKCNAKVGQCDCWTKCDAEGCKWSYEKGGECGNPEHEKNPTQE